jgi:hypothetical protein
MRAVRAIILELAKHAEATPHVLPALDLIYEVARLATYLKIATLGDDGTVTVIEFEPGRTLGEIRTILSTSTPEAIGASLGTARLLLQDLVARDSNRTVISARRLAREVLHVIEKYAVLYRRASDHDARTSVVSAGANGIMGLTGVRPDLKIVSSAMAAGSIKRGRPPGSKNKSNRSRHPRRVPDAYAASLAVRSCC